MIEMLKVKRLVMVTDSVGVLLEDGTVLVKSGNDFVSWQTGEAYRPVVDMTRKTVLGFSSTL